VVTGPGCQRLSLGEFADARRAGPPTGFLRKWRRAARPRTEFSRTMRRSVKPGYGDLRPGPSRRHRHVAKAASGRQQIWAKRERSPGGRRSCGNSLFRLFEEVVREMRSPLKNPGGLPIDAKNKATNSRVNRSALLRGLFGDGRSQRWNAGPIFRFFDRRISSVFRDYRDVCVFRT